MYNDPTIDQLVAMKSARFAHFSALGTWSDGKECKICGAHTYEYIPPLLVRWEPSTEIIGDFSWDGPFGYLFIVKDHVAKFLRAMIFGCDFYSVEYVPPKQKRKIKCCPYPYEGTELKWGKCNTFVDLDLQASEVSIRESCSVCGTVDYTFRNNGIVIPRRNWRGEKMFRITTNGKSLATFVTEEGRSLIEDAGFSNVAFAEAGEISE